MIYRNNIILFVTYVAIFSQNFDFNSILCKRTSIKRFWIVGITESFYRRPLQEKPPTYGNQLVSVNNLKLIMKLICKIARLEGNYSNYSEKGVDDQEIRRPADNRSEETVRTYKRLYFQKVSAVLQPIP